MSTVQTELLSHNWLIFQSLLALVCLPHFCLLSSEGHYRIHCFLPKKRKEPLRELEDGVNREGAGEEEKRQVQKGDGRIQRDDICLAKMPAAMGHPHSPSLCLWKSPCGSSAIRAKEVGVQLNNLGRISQGIRKLPACVCVCLAVFLHSLIEEMLPFRPAIVRLPFCRQSLGQAQGTLERCGPATKSTSGDWRGRIWEASGKGKDKYSGEGSKRLPAWLVYYHSLGRKNAQAVLLWQRPACSIFFLFSFVFSILLPQFPNSPRQIPTTSSALIFPACEKSVANTLWVICLIKAPDICWSWYSWRNGRKMRGQVN